MHIGKQKSFIVLYLPLNGIVARSFTQNFSPLLSYMCPYTVRFYDHAVQNRCSYAPIPELIRLYEQRLLQCEQSPQQPLPDLAFFRQCRIAVIAAAAMRTRRAQSNRCIIGSPPRYRQQEPRSMPRSTASSRSQLSSALSRILVESWLPPRCREYTAA